MLKRVLCAGLSLVLLFSMALGAFAQETESARPQRVITLEKPEDLLKLAQDCRLDTYSEDLQVILKNSIDMTGCEFYGIPYFIGSFEGRGHTISGVKLTADGSYQGLFRYLGEGR